MLGNEFLDFLIAGAFEAVGQLVVGEVRRQGIVAQGIEVAAIGSTVAFGEGLLGLIVILALLAEGGGGRVQAKSCNEQAETQTGESAAHGTSVKRGLWLTGGLLCRGAQERPAAATSLACRIGQLNAV